MSPSFIELHQVVVERDGAGLARIENWDSFVREPLFKDGGGPRARGEQRIGDDDELRLHEVQKKIRNRFRLLRQTADGHDLTQGRRRVDARHDEGLRGQEPEAATHLLF